MYRIEVAVIRPDFTFIRFWPIYSTQSRLDAIKYFSWMQKYLQCHAILRLYGEAYPDKRAEINAPKGEYRIPPIRNQ